MALKSQSDIFVSFHLLIFLRQPGVVSLCLHFSMVSPIHSEQILMKTIYLEYEYR